MFRILSAGPEMMASSIILIPAVLTLGKTLIHNAGRTICYTVFALYLAAVYTLAGLPSVLYIRPDLSFGFVPFIGMASNIEASVLNVLLFVPLGLLLPVLARKFQAMKQTVLCGLVFTVLIEFLQMFTYRATDINDVITNLAGTIIGYFLAKGLLSVCPQLARIASGGRDCELYAVCGIVFVILFFIQPFLSILFWNMGTSGL